MSRSSPKARGFTLLELMVVVAVIGILAAVAYATSRAMSRNARLDGAMEEVVVTFASQRAEALGRQQDVVAVLMDRVPGKHPVRLFLLYAPTAAWSLEKFDPEKASAEVANAERQEFPDQLQLLPKVAPAAPRPYQTVKFFDSTMTTTCDGVTCFAVRYLSDGTVRGDTPEGKDAGLAGFGFVLGTDLEGEVAAAKRRALLLGFPTGVFRSYVP